jgi:hypothetical protein
MRTNSCGGFLLLALAASALADGEFLVDTSGVQAEMWPTVASDGTDYLVVWHDNRGSSDFDI